ncbi:MAG: hypothetical protein WD738_23050 [Pirellulales bacterium]
MMLLLTIADRAWAQEQPAATDTQSTDAQQSAAGGELSVEQARLADRFKRLEEVVGRLAELSGSTDPRRARLLRQAIAQSREQDINVRFESIVKLLEDERLSAAATNQTDLQKELDELLTLLLKADRDKELASERDRVRQYLKEVARLIRLQKGIRARTEGGDELRPLSEDQQRVASDTGKLSGNIDETEGDKKPEPDNQSETKDGQSPDESKPADSAKPADSESGKPSAGEPSESQPGDGKPSNSQPSQPSQGQPGSPSPSDGSESENQPSEPQDPADRATQRLRAAQQQMDEARKKLDEAKRKGAAARQREALKNLEQAKAELERVLRQLREEELERTLTQLAARFRKMLELQTAVYEGTVRLDRVPQAQRDHDDEIEAARLSRQESQIVHEADKALLLLREDGSSVAFPEAVEQMRDDMQQVVERLAAVKVDAITQAVEQDILAALEETIAALEKAIKDLEKNRTPPGQPSMAGQPTEPQLVDKLAELKMIRSLEMRIYQRTKRYGEMIEGEQAETAELLEALKVLAERQQRVHQATADLQQGRND